MRIFTCTFIIGMIFCCKPLHAQKTYELKPVTVSAERKVDTVFGTWKFSVADYEFYGDKLVLLTFTRNMAHASVMLTDNAQHILSRFDVPGEAQKLFRDYQGNINVICKSKVYRITVRDDVIHLASLPADDFNARIVPCIDTIGRDIYFSNYSRDYPEFTYYAYNTADSSLHPFKTVTDREELKSYNMEYYFLEPHDRFRAAKLANEYHVDKHRVAAVMSGVTNSIFYTPLYAPLFVFNDTVCVFDHYSNAILTYNKNHALLDSVPIDYNHPKNWREWKHEVIMDRSSHKAYALYQKDGFYYLMHIDLKSGKVTGSFRLTNPYVEKIRIRDDYVYYVYRPFGSLQERFVYKELIRN